MNEGVRKKRQVSVDPSAIVHPSAELESGVTVGPYSVIGEDVRIGKDTIIGPHVVVEGVTTVGSNCRIYQFCSIGAPPQDIGYKGEKTETVIGDNNIIREFVTVHRGTPKDKTRTVCGNNNFFMNYVHIAHDCVIGDNVIMANAATLAGHVTVEDFSIVGGLVAVHQHVNIGAYCIIGGASAVSKDIPPYVMAVGNRAHVYGINSIGIRRRGFSREEIDEIKKSYTILFRSSLPIKEALERLKSELPNSIHAKRFIDFIQSSKRGVARVRMHKKTEEAEM